MQVSFGKYVFNKEEQTQKLKVHRIPGNSATTYAVLGVLRLLANVGHATVETVD